MFESLKCLFSGHRWKYQYDIIDGPTGGNFGKTYKCAKCSLVKHETLDGRCIID